MTDAHGQPPAAFHHERNLWKATESLLGLCRGLLADNELRDCEITFLDTWMRDNARVLEAWPGSVIGARVREVLADGYISTEEREDLQSVLAEITGMDLASGITGGLSNTIATAAAPAVAFQGRRFCLTGKFLYGTRQRCEHALIERGATPLPSVTRALDYLVIGALASRDWINTSHGRKIEKAEAYQRRGAAITLLEEETWTAAL